MQSHDSVEQWHVEVDLVAEQWFVVDERGHTHEFRDGVTIHDGQPVDRKTHVSEEIFDPLTAAFPEQLGWWGEHNHSFRPVLAERVGNQSVLLTFEHGADPSMRSTLVVDAKLGLVTRVVHFGSPFIVIVDVELGRGVERLTPAAFPALDIIHPDF